VDVLKIELCWKERKKERKETCKLILCCISYAVGIHTAVSVERELQRAFMIHQQLLLYYNEKATNTCTAGNS